MLILGKFFIHKCKCMTTSEDKNLLLFIIIFSVFICLYLFFIIKMYQ